MTWLGSAASTHDRHGVAPAAEQVSAPASTAQPAVVVPVIVASPVDRGIRTGPA